MNSEFYEQNFQELKAKYPTFVNFIDYKLFSVLCIKYFFFAEDNIPFDQDIVNDFICDGANDGGIDAIFNDPHSSNNDVIIVQSKFYNSTSLMIEELTGELTKICDTIENLRKNKVKNYSDKLVTAFVTAENQMSDDAEFKIKFFTSFMPNNKTARTKLEKISSKFSYDIDFIFNDDIKNEIDLQNNGQICVQSDKLTIDNKDNKLFFEGSLMVNISAKSLQLLHHKYRNGLFGLNLRYQVMG